MRDLQDWLDEEIDKVVTCIALAFGGDLSYLEKEDYQQIALSKSAIRKHILQEALSLIGDDLPLDTEPNTGQRIHNKVKQELRNKFNDKYKEV